VSLNQTAVNNIHHMFDVIKTF